MNTLSSTSQGTLKKLSGVLGVAKQITMEKMGIVEVTAESVELKEETRKLYEHKVNLKEVYKKILKLTKSMQASAEDGEILSASLLQYSEMIQANAESILLAGCLKKLGEFLLFYNDLMQQLSSVLQTKMALPILDFIETDIEEAKIAKKRYDKERVAFEAACTRAKTAMENKAVKGNAQKTAAVEKELLEQKEVYRKTEDETYEVLVETNYKNEYFVLDVLFQFFDGHRDTYGKTFSYLSDLETDMKGYKGMASKKKSEEAQRKHMMRKQSRMPRQKTFGVNLDVLVAREKTPVPIVAQKCFDFLTAHGIHCEGIFRVSPQKIILEELESSIEQGEDIAFNTSTDTHVVSALLKSFLRRLPDPLFPHSIYSELTSVNLKASPSAVGDMKKVLSKLPEANHNFCRGLFFLCKAIDKNSEVTKMGAGNLATVLGPNILYPEVFDPLTMMDDLENANSVVQFIISHVDELFGKVSSTPTSTSPTPTPTPTPTPASTPAPASPSTSTSTSTPTPTPTPAPTTTTTPSASPTQHVTPLPVPTRQTPSSHNISPRAGAPKIGVGAPKPPAVSVSPATAASAAAAAAAASKAPAYPPPSPAAGLQKFKGNIQQLVSHLNVKSLPHRPTIKNRLRAESSIAREKVRQKIEGSHFHGQEAETDSTSELESEAKEIEVQKKPEKEIKEDKDDKKDLLPLDDSFKPAEEIETGIVGNLFGDFAVQFFAFSTATGEMVLSLRATPEEAPKFMTHTTKCLRNSISSLKILLSYSSSEDMPSFFGDPVHRSFVLCIKSIQNEVRKLISGMKLYHGNPKDSANRIALLDSLLLCMETSWSVATTWTDSQVALSIYQAASSSARALQVATGAIEDSVSRSAEDASRVHERLVRVLELRGREFPKKEMRDQLDKSTQKIHTTCQSLLQIVNQLQFAPKDELANVKTQATTLVKSLAGEFSLITNQLGIIKNGKLSHVTEIAEEGVKNLKAFPLSLLDNVKQKSELIELITSIGNHLDALKSKYVSLFLDDVRAQISLIDMEKLLEILRKLSTSVESFVELVLKVICNNISHQQEDIIKEDLTQILNYGSQIKLSVCLFLLNNNRNSRLATSIYGFGVSLRQLGGDLRLMFMECN